jgi:hypothetical protein
VLQNLEITNFRTFSHLAIPHLGRVNLIVGRNNEGKTTLLEALRLYGSLWPARTASVILYERDEVTGDPEEGPRLLLHSLFHGRQPVDGAIATIGPVRSPNLGPGSSPSSKEERKEDETILRISSYVETTTTTPEPWSGSGIQGPFPAPIGLTLRFEIEGREFELHDNRSIGYRIPSGSVKPPEFDSGPVFLHGSLANAKGLDETPFRWDGIALTPGEQRVYEALALVTPVGGVSFVQDPRKPLERMAKVRPLDHVEPMPMGALGEGVTRIFQIAVAIEYAAMIAKRGADRGLPSNVFPMVLIDEIEVGTHYTLHADLWKFVFKTARELGVQVFATTHSWDCINGFQSAAAEDADSEGLLIRLESGRGKFKAVLFSEEELEIITRDEIEVR